MTTIGIIGAGTMGCGVAQTFAEYGYNILLLDISHEALEKAKRIFITSLDFVCSSKQKT